MAKSTTPTLVFTQPLANVVIKTTQLGSTVPRKHVTPAELMYLVADNHANAGGNPVMELVEIDPETEATQIAATQADIESVQKKINDTNELELTEEVRERRLNALQSRLNSLQDRVQYLQSIQRIRTLSPAQECRRLGDRYGSRKIKRFFPGASPSIPTSFAVAKQDGLTGEIARENLATVGATSDQDYLVN